MPEAARGQACLCAECAAAARGDDPTAPVDSRPAGPTWRVRRAPAMAEESTWGVSWSPA